MNADSSRVISCSWDRTVKQWEVSTGKLLSAARYERADLSTVAWPEDASHVYVAGEDGFVNRWTTGGNGKIEGIGFVSGVVTSLSVTPAGHRLVSGSAGGNMHLWDMQDTERGSAMRGHDGDVGAVAITHDGCAALSGSADKAVLLWNLDSLEITRAFYGHQDIVSSVSISQDGLIGASGSWDGTVRFWDLGEGAALSRLEFQSQVWAVSTTPDMRMMVVGEKSGLVSFFALDRDLLAGARQ